MPKRIYVGNLPFSATDEEVRQMFAEYGSVNNVSLITDRETGRPRGFGFVEMAEGDTEAAISQLDGQPLDGRPLRVNEAKERAPRSGGGGFGGGRGGGGRNRY